jgi:hypothetical protein
VRKLRLFPPPVVPVLSAAVGVAHIWTNRASPTDPSAPFWFTFRIVPFFVVRNLSPFPIIAPGPESCAVTVGNNTYPVSPVRGIDGTSRNNKRLAGVPDAFQVRKHLVDRHTDDSSNILTNNPSGPEFFDNTQHFRPEETVIFLASSLPGDRKRLAGESA